MHRLILSFFITINLFFFLCVDSHNIQLKGYLFIKLVLLSMAIKFTLLFFNEYNLATVNIFLLEYHNFQVRKGLFIPTLTHPFVS